MQYYFRVSGIETGVLVRLGLKSADEPASTSSRGPDELKQLVSRRSEPGSDMTHPAIVAGTVGVSLARCAGPKWMTGWIPYRQILRKHTLCPRFGVIAEALTCLNVQDAEGSSLPVARCFESASTGKFWRWTILR